MKVLSKKVHCLAAVFVGLVIAGAAMASAMASAQDVYKVNYFDNNFAAAPKGATVAVPAPDAKVRIDNPGLTYGNLCAMIYVFAADQQLAECCGCIQTHNGLTKLSVRRDLTSNPLTGVVPISGVIKVVSATPHSGVCDPTMGVTPKANLRVWVTYSGCGSPGQFSRGGVSDHRNRVL